MARSKPPEGRRFVKGQSGNPSGKKAIPADVKEAFARMTPKALEVLEKILDNENEDPRIRLRAVEVVLDRHLGKPADAATMIAIERKADGTIEALELVRMAPRAPA